MRCSHGISTKYSNYFLFLLLLLLPVSSVRAQTKGSKQLEVHVFEADGKAPIPGVVVRLEEHHTLTNAQGVARLAWYTGRKAHLVVHAVGYQQQQRSLSFDEVGAEPIVFFLKNLELEEVVITADKRKREKTTVAVRMTQAQLKENVGKNLAQLLQQVPGMSSISSGATIMKPVIQGMHSSRILLINNGVRQEGQQWGADHAPEVDASSVTDMEVIKGAESIRYGAGAIGGVILMNTATLPSEEKWGGKLLIRGASNARSIGLNADTYGGISQVEGLRWRWQASALRAGDYSTAEYVLNNTGVREGGTTLALGWKRPTWELDAFASLYYAQLGVFFGAHIGTLDDLLARLEVGKPINTVPATYALRNPKQEVLHLIGRITGRYSMGVGGSLRGQYDIQSNARNEFENRPGRFQYAPSMGLFLTTHSGHISWESDKHVPLRFIVGSTLSLQQNANRNDTGSVPLIPNYGAFSWGGYAIAKYVRQKYELEAGLRYDYKYLDAKGYDNLGRFYGGEKSFRSPSFSLSAMRRLGEKASISSNLGLAWRAPDVNELYSNGLHHGAASYEIGDEHLAPEAAWKWNNELSYSDRYFAFTVTLFGQWIKNYIYDAPQTDPLLGGPEVKELLAGVFPIFRYKQANALFYGGDASLTVQPFPTLSYRVEGQWVRAINRDTNGYFPYIPSDRYSQRIEWQPPLAFRGVRQVSLALEHLYVMQQTRFDPNIDFIPHTPPAYHLMGLSLAASFPMGKGLLEVRLKGDNLFNRLYKEYTNRFRYYAHEKGRDFQLAISYTL